MGKKHKKDQLAFCTICRNAFWASQCIYVDYLLGHKMVCKECKKKDKDAAKPRSTH